MYELSVLLADYKILIHAHNEYVVHQCGRYTLPSPLTPEEADLVVRVSPEEIAAEKEGLRFTVSDGYCESICIYRAICRRLPLLGGMLLHSAVITDGTHGYAYYSDLFKLDEYNNLTGTYVWILSFMEGLTPGHHLITDEPAEDNLFFYGYEKTREVFEWPGLPFGEILP